MCPYTPDVARREVVIAGAQVGVFFFLVLLIIRYCYYYHYSSVLSRSETRSLPITFESFQGFVSSSAQQQIRAPCRKCNRSFEGRGSAGNWMEMLRCVSMPCVFYDLCTPSPSLPPSRFSVLPFVQLPSTLAQTHASLLLPNAVSVHVINGHCAPSPKGRRRRRREKRISGVTATAEGYLFALVVAVLLQRD
jgi:hypothetical protein